MMWAFDDSLSVKGYVILMGDFNGDLGNSLSEKSALDSDQRGLKLLELADYFNLCPINLLGLCTDTFISHFGRYRSTLDYIFVPNCLFEIYSAKTFDLSVENTSDHLPIMIKLNHSKIPDCAKILKEKYLTGSRSKTKILWSKFSHEEIDEKYVTPLLADLSEFDMCDFVNSKAAANKILQLLIDNSLSLVPSVLSRNKNTARGYVMLNFRVTSRLPVQCVRLHLTHGRSIIFSVMVTPTTLTVVLVKNIVCFYLTS